MKTSDRTSADRPVISSGATVEQMALAWTDAWHDNAFVHTVVDLAPGFPLLAVTVFAMALVSCHLWRVRDVMPQTIRSDGVSQPSAR